IDCQRKQKKMMEYYENRKTSIINEYEERKRNALEKAKKDAETKKQQLILKNRSDMHLSILKKKQEFSERLTDEVKSKIESFIATEEYTNFLEKAIKQVLTRFSKSQYVSFNFSKNDIKKRQEIILKTIKSVRDENTFQINGVDDLIGGVFVKSGDGRMEIDFTINTILEESDKLIGEVLSSRLSKEL
ncbi:MAG TPA: V-type ATP synthase subunit E, partial [Atribacterota bacterium]|nr:V-type ATP synthase subunit E [Atribacterota bacterium]